MQTQDIIIRAVELAVFAISTFILGHMKGKRAAAEEAAKNKQA